MPKVGTFHVRTARTVHSLTIGREYTEHGRRSTNSADTVIGKADCGAITSGAATHTDQPVTCPRCRNR